LLSGRGRSAKRGFTLVEVIVVLVILAILAAIAIPALTGYIDKAQDKEYIAMARNYAVAVRTIVDEAYAAAKLDPDYITTGDTNALPLRRQFYLTDALGDGLNAVIRPDAAKLVDMTFLAASGPSIVDFILVGSSDSTALTAQGFIFMFCPNGTGTKPEICVTYGLPDLNGDYDWPTYYSNLANADFNTSYGYQVYHWN
jgi:prepilin-type N-terminal cleavage/methylation domain-containing protein